MKFLSWSAIFFAASVCILIPWHGQSEAADKDIPLNPIISLLLSKSLFFTPQNVTVKVDGIQGTPLTLILNDQEEMTLPADGSTSFQTQLKSFANYQVKIKNSPILPNQGCRMSNATGIIVLKEAVVTVDCTTNGYPVGGTVSGLDGVGLTLALEDQTHGGIQRRKMKADGDFVLAALLDGSQYNVTILSQPIDNSQICTLENGSGTVSGGAVTDLAVSCTTRAVKMNITRFGLLSGDSVPIADNAPGWIPEPTFSVSGGTDGSLLKMTSAWVVDGDAYDFSIVGTSQDGKECALTNRSGIADDLITMELHCYPASSRTVTIGGNVDGLGLNMITPTTITLSLNNGLEYLDVSGPSDANGQDFTFNLSLYPLRVVDGSVVPNIYSVSIAKQPQSAICTVEANATGNTTVDVTDVHVACVPYVEPVAQMSPGIFVPNAGPLDASLTTLGDAPSVTYSWGSSSVHDFSFTNNGTTDPQGVTIHTDLLEDPLYLDEASCVDDPLCFTDIISNGFSIDATVADTGINLYVVDSGGHESSDSETTYVYDENYAYVKRLGTGTGASPDNAAGDIKVAIAYAKANGKSRVAIAQGTYTINIDNGPVTMVEGVSLYGGYSASTWEYDPKTYRTEIRAQGTGVIADVTPANPISTVIAGSGITEATWIQGLNIYGPLLLNKAPVTALFITGGNVTVQDNTLVSSNQGAGGWTGLTIADRSNSLIRNNIIIADDGPFAELSEVIRSGTGIVIYGAAPTIDSNRIRGGGVRGIGVTVYDAMPNIFNNTIIGCEDKTMSQVCYGVEYLGGQSLAGGKLYNNTIFGGKSYTDSTSNLGVQSVAVITSGIWASPEIVNNILYAQNNTVGAEIKTENRATCIASLSISPGALPASIYNNACIRGQETCFHNLQVRDSRNMWEKAWDTMTENVSSYGPIGLLAFPAGVLQYSLVETAAQYNWVCRTAADSNFDVFWEQLSDTLKEQYETAFEFFDYHLEWLPSGGNVDVNDPNFFVDIDGPDNNFSTIEDNNWNLTGSAPVAIIEGGKCLAPEVFRDMDRGASRTPLWSAASGCFEETGYSMGAYEYNY
ncbi:MAG: right-handed parallel beta-helix repeat-containing protein [Proteobacteria bacterium]|nr:right-handed parallel beta-helix repeat-containing protein [Pseudomonadota bacterium]